jgi:hypothetical protein
MGKRFLLVVSVMVGIAAGCANGAVDPFPPDDDGGTIPTPDGGSCTMCGGTCADLKTDPANCGKCGKACPMGATCVQGSCQCPSGQSNCNNVCVDTKTDVANCGKCGAACGGDGGTIMGGGAWACVNGSCAIMCPQPKVECSGACVDTKTDNDNCGMCGNACVAMTEQCVEGQCCKIGQVVCGGMCTDIKSDPNNCGMCGKQCSGNTPVCNNGTCQAGCVDPNDVQFNGKCYYLDGSNGVCAQGYVLSSNAALAAILQANPNAWQGKNYHKTISSNCCVLTSDNVQNYGMVTHCNSNGPFSAGEPKAGGAGCTNISPPIKTAQQLTLCQN